MYGERPKGLEPRVLGYLLLVAGAVSAVVIGGTAGTILSGAIRSDRAEALATVDVAVDYLATRRMELIGNAASLSRWEVSRLLSADTAPAKVGFTGSGLADMGVDVFAVYDSASRLRRAIATTLSTEPQRMRKQVAGLLRTWPELNAAVDRGAIASGIVRLADGRLLLAAAAPIAPTGWNGGAPVGSVLLGRVLDDAEFDILSRDTQHQITVTPTSESSATGGGSSFVRPRDVTTQQGVTYLKDIRGDIAAELAVLNSRTAWRSGILTVAVLSAGLVMVAVTTVSVVRGGLRRLLLYRIFALNAQVARIQQTGRAEHVMVGGNDELSALAENVDLMVSTLEESRAELQSAHDTLEARVDERTEELVRTVNELEEQVAARRNAEQERASSDARYRLLIDNLTDTVFALDPGGLVTFISPGVEWAFGYLPEDVIGKPIAALLTLPSAKSVERQMERGLARDGTVLSLEAITADGQLLHVEMVLNRVDSSVGAVQGIIRDVTARRRYEEELLHIASHDFLTGLANRRAFEEELDRALHAAERHHTQGAVLWMDLDNFKDVNDTLGHHAGDELLTDIARALRNSIRSESVLARLGGDEFAVLLPTATRQEAREAGERLLAQIAGVHIFFEGRIVRARGSMGIVMFPDDGFEVDELLSRADLAMYRAKQLGRARSVFFTRDEDWREAVEDRRAWAEQVELAVREGSFEAHAQPIVDLSTGMARDFQLLVRMVDVDGGLILPAQFMGVAEQTGLIVEVDLWMMRKAIRLLRELENSDLRLNVNVSPRTLVDERFIAEAARILSISRLDADRLGIEIVESAVVVDIGRTQSVLRELKKIGCRVLLDGFGSGFTSFLHLKQLPIDTLKIDGSYVTRLMESENDQHLVRAMVEMARGLGMGTIAEAVEVPESIELLRRFGVDAVEGNAIGRAGPAIAVIQAELAQSEARSILLAEF